MSTRTSKYSRAIIRQLKVLATPNEEELDYKAAYVAFTDLWEDLDEAFSHGLVTDRQRVLIDAVFDCLYQATLRPDRFRLASEEYLRSSPEWEPMRVAARAAIKALES